MTGTTETETPLRVRFLRLPEVLERTGPSRSTIYVRLEQGLFPMPRVVVRPRGGLDRDRCERADPPADRGGPGRRWTAWETATIRAVDRFGIGLLRVRYGDADDPRFAGPQALRRGCPGAVWHP